MSRSLPDAPASARGVTAELGDLPVKLFVAGGIGTGKSTAMAAARRALGDAGCSVVTVVPSAPAKAAVVIDDAHLLSADELRRLTELCAEPDLTVVVAAEVRDHDPHLRALALAIERQHPQITLGALPIGEISRLLPLPPERLDEVMAATAGLPFLIAGLNTAGFETDAIADSVFFGLIERLRRLGQQQLEALLITSLSADLGAADLAAALEVSADDAQPLVDRARATGLIEPHQSSKFRRSVHRAAAQLVGAARHHELESGLLRTQLEFSTLTGELAMRLAEHGLHDARLAQPLRDHAAATHVPAERVRIYRAAVDAGALDLRPALAEALALSGDCSGAAALADELLSSPDAGQRAGAARVAAAVAAHDGTGSQGAEVFSWLGPYPDATVGAAAAVVYLGVGDLSAARTAADTAHAGPPTAAARAARALSEGLLLTVEGRYPEAANLLGQVATSELPAMPDSPAALTTLAALHSGDSVRAHSVISRAADADGARALFSTRHRLLRAWVGMQNGQFDQAGQTGDAVHARDALWAAALRTAVARRRGDAGALQRHWHDGLEVLSEFSIDLYSLLPLGELWMGAARLGHQDLVGPAVDRAFAVLAALGDPPAWSLPLHWAGVHAGIIAGDPPAVAPHAQALSAAAPDSPFATALAAAGRTWLNVLANNVVPDEVASATRRLAQFGLTSDATRLAGQAALHAPDPKVSALMLQIARDLQIGGGELTAGNAVETAPPRSAYPSRSLSDREREVARLLLLGMPYRDIGTQLFISAKTVEHHVARIRRRIGAQSRSEMLSMLRTMLE